MIVEMRTYTTHSGKVPEFSKAYQELGADIQIPIQGGLIGAFTTDIGPLNQVVHMWAYKDLNDRDERRNRLAADPAWGQYLGKATD